MTVYTKQNLENDEKKEVPVLGLEVKVNKASPTPAAVRSTALREAETGIDRLLRQRRRKTLCIQFFLLLGILLGLSITLLGTLYLYKNKSSQQSYSGWCGVRYTPRYAALSELPDSPTTKSFSYLDEQITIDGNTEILEVPQFDDNDEATFVQDFNQEITLIQDDTDEVCYIMPLDTEKIPLPTTLLELILRAQAGDFTPDAEEIQEDYRVLQPALENSEVSYLYGEFIASRCYRYKTYELIKIPDEATTTSTTTAAYLTYDDLLPFLKKFGMYPGGRYLIRYRIFA